MDARDMTPFKDKNGTEWKFEITIGVRRRVKEATGIDFFDVVAGQGLIAKLNEADAFCSVAWVLVEKQCHDAGISNPDDFFDLFDGHSAKQAIAALLDEIAFFLEALNHPLASVFVAGLRKAREAEPALREAMEKHIAAVEKEIDSELMRLSDFATSSPVLLASATRSPGRSTSSRGSRKAARKTSGGGRRRS
jgi:hypothetical protein